MNRTVRTADPTSAFSADQAETVWLTWPPARCAGSIRRLWRAHLCAGRDAARRCGGAGTVARIGRLGADYTRAGWWSGFVTALGFQPLHGFQVIVALATGSTHIGLDAGHRASVPQTNGDPPALHALRPARDAHLQRRAFTRRAWRSWRRRRRRRLRVCPAGRSHLSCR